MKKYLLVFALMLGIAGMAMAQPHHPVKKRHHHKHHRHHHVRPHHK
ncbi:MAG: hypothetical protein JST87_13555 [Bacteroidetes bacterium]|nr:hypothetical protein [Bacteroidota bacterium]MBS1933699.1 hypothetical protein [Bacteroidota bacterium]